eukprot:2079744-Rhodomonas_salina.1
MVPVLLRGVTGANVGRALQRLQVRGGASERVGELVELLGVCTALAWLDLGDGRLNAGAFRLGVCRWVSLDCCGLLSFALKMMRRMMMMMMMQMVCACRAACGGQSWHADLKAPHVFSLDFSSSSHLRAGAFRRDGAVGSADGKADARARRNGWESARC